MNRVFVLLAVLLGILLAGCGSGSGGGFNSRVPDSRKNVFRYPLPTFPTSLDPAKVQDGDTIDVVQQVFEGLVQWSEDSKVIPNLAEKWDITEGGTRYVFKLKPGVKFSNGREVTADDFKWSFERATNPKFGSPTAATYLSDIVGVKEKLDGKAYQVSGIKVLAKDQLEIRIDKPRPYFLGKLTYACSFVIAQEAVQDPTADLTRIEQMIGTGPYTFEKIENEQLVVLAANKGYHGGAPKIEKVERPVVKDAQTRLNMYRTGEVDLVQLERQDVKAIQADDKLKSDIKFFDRPALWYIGLNNNVVPALKDVRVRRALAMAIDRDKIVNEVLDGVNKRADGILPPGVVGSRDNAAVLGFDVAQAKKLLAEAGFADGKGFPEIEMFFRDGRPDVEIVAAAVQQQWLENLGVKIKLRKTEWGSYLQKHNTKSLPLFHMRWAADYLDPENFLSTLLAAYGPENKVNYNNAQFNALCREADTTMDEAKRFKLYAQAEDLVLAEAPFIPIYFQRDAELISSRVKGLRESLFGHLPHTTVELQ